MHILLVEDNQSDAHLLTEFLSEEENPPTVDWVTDGYLALDYVYKREKYKQAKTPDFILLDLGLPRISGYEVLKDLKTHRNYSAIPVVILSTSCNPLDQEQCQRLGADRYISKPRNLSEYKTLVQKLMTFQPSPARPGLRALLQ